MARNAISAIGELKATWALETLAGSGAAVERDWSYRMFRQLACSNADKNVQIEIPLLPQIIDRASRGGSMALMRASRGIIVTL